MQSEYLPFLQQNCIGFLVNEIVALGYCKQNSFK